MATRKVTCKRCWVKLLVPAGTRSIPCPNCGVIIQCNRNSNAHFYPANTLIGNVIPTTAYNPLPQFQISSPLPSSISPPAAPIVYGRKRALLCGVSYRGHAKSLQGSINNVLRIKHLLVERFGFPKEYILLLTEDEGDPHRTPTKSNIRKAMRWLVQGCQPGDSLVFYFSGHSTRVRDLNGDEIDGQDEALCPLDYQTRGSILDDEINEIIVRPLPPGAILHAIVDTCFSGTLLDLPFMCRMNRDGYYMWEDHRMPCSVYRGTSGGIAVSLSACDDHQSSADVMDFNMGTASGALTYSLVQTLENQPKLTYGSLLNAIRTQIYKAQNRDGLSASQLQEPQLSSSERFDIHSKQFLL